MRMLRSRAVVVIIAGCSALLALLVAAGSLVASAIPSLLGPGWCAVAAGCGLTVFRGVPARILGWVAVLAAAWGVVDIAYAVAAGAGSLAVALAVVAMAGLGSAGVLAIVGARRWRSLGDRYARGADAPESGRPLGPIALWDALDRGEDPTGDNRSGLMNP